MMFTTSNEWVLMSEELPPIGEPVLGYNSVTGKISILTYWETHWSVASTGNKEFKISPANRMINIKHWRLFPPPPMSAELQADIAEMFDTTALRSATDEA